MDHAIRVSSAQSGIFKIESLRKEILRGLLILLLVSVTFLFLRIILKLFGANPESLFAGFIYLVSGIFLLPFSGIFPQYQDVLPGQSSVDISAFLAIFCYTILIFMAMGVVQLGAKVMRIGEQANKTIEKKETVDSTIVDQTLE